MASSPPAGRRLARHGVQGEPRVEGRLGQLGSPSPRMTVPDYGPRSRPDRVGTEARLPCQVGEFPRQSVASWAGSWSAGRLQARVRAGLSGPLDRHPDQVAPLHPGAVVVAHVAEPEQLAEHEPGVAGALADAAVGDDVVVGLEAELALVDGPQLVDLLEGAVLVGRPLP